MSKKSVIAFIAGLGSGYIKAAGEEDEKARKDKADARAQEEHDVQMADAADKKKTRDALAEAGKTATVNDNAATLDISGKPAVYDDAGVAGSDYRQARRMAEATGADASTIAPPKAAIGVSTLPGTQFSDSASAQAAADAFNAPAARSTRMVAALNGTGQPLQATQLEHGAQQAEVTKMALDQAKDEKKRNDAFRDVVTKFKDGGWAAVPSIYDNYKDGKTATVVEDGKGGATVVTHDKDGNEVGRKAFANPMEFITGAVANLDPKLYVGLEEKRAEKDQAQKNADRAFEENRRQFGITKDISREQLGISAGHLKLAKERLDADLKNDPFRNIPAGTKAQAQNLSKQIDTINTAITNATVKGELNMETAKPLIEKQAALTIQYNALLQPYTGRDAAKPDADPLGLRTKPAAAPAPAPAPAAPVKAAAPVNAAAAGIPAATVDPIVVKLQAETHEMNDFKRTAYSPDVQAYLDKKKADQAAADQAASDAYRARELQRSLAASRGLAR